MRAIAKEADRICLDQMHPQRIILKQAIAQVNGVAVVITDSEKYPCSFANIESARPMIVIIVLGCLQSYCSCV